MTTSRRIVALVRSFTELYGHAPTVIANAPGRVNLIGEHTDYNGLPVLPMAIERSILVAGAPRDDRRIELANVDPDFSPRRYDLAEIIAPYADGDWGNYHKAGAQGLLGALGASALHGGDFLVEGNIPRAAGLSSSAALVIGSALALLEVNECEVAPQALAELMASAERYVGTMSGGMDQAICLLAKVGHALRIDFDPLRTRAVPVPRDVAVVVCDSLVAAEKSGAARLAYNQRVTECRLACRVLGILTLGDELVPHLGALRQRLPDRSSGDLVALLKGTLGDVCSLDAIARVLRTTVGRLSFSPGANPKAAYPLVARTRHVLSEGERVGQAEDALRHGDWRVLGALMNASHASCRDDYEISCSELEELVAAARGAGAHGARLTGAGFGGCTVNLVPAEGVDRFVSLVDWEYYQKRRALGVEHCFVFTPSAGATALRL
jgi:N-acetylgalactosamine kinase